LNRHGTTESDLTVEERPLPVEERLLQLLQHLGIEQAHFAGGPAWFLWYLHRNMPPHIVSSMTGFFLPPALPHPDALSDLRPLAGRLLTFFGERGPVATEEQQRFRESLPGTTAVIFRDYFSPFWADVVADRTKEIGDAMLEFLARIDQEQESTAAPLAEGEGEVAGISYRIQGSGPPLVLLPLGLAPSQWEPLLPRLSEHYCAITLGGEIGWVRILEKRGRTPGWLRVVGNLIDQILLRPGESVLDVGCGTGVYDRWLAHRTGRANRVTGLDINGYLLREAAALVRKEGLEGVVEFRQGSADALPFPDNSFDVTMTVGVMAEVDADRMLAEMARVTKPGGRVAVITFAFDVPSWMNLPLSAELKTKVETTGGRGVVTERGCADASLYRRFHQAGLVQVSMFLQLCTQLFTEQIEREAPMYLSREERDAYREAVDQAEAEGTAFIAFPLHCAVGTKP